MTTDQKPEPFKKPLSPVHADKPTVKKPDAVLTDGPAGEEEKPDPTRFGDWEKNGRCIDF